MRKCVKTNAHSLPASEQHQFQPTRQVHITSHECQPEDVNSRDDLLVLRAFRDFLFFIFFFIIQRTAQKYDMPTEITGYD